MICLKICLNLYVFVLYFPYIYIYKNKKNKREIFKTLKWKHYNKHNVKPHSMQHQERLRLCFEVTIMENGYSWFDVQQRDILEESSHLPLSLKAHKSKHQ